MIKLPYRIIRTAILTLFLTGCSEDLSKMSILEQSLHQPDRFSGDKSSDKSRKPLDILEFSDVKADMKIIDLLGGGGYYTELFNYVVGDKGKVYIQNTTLFLRFSKDELEKRLKNNRLKNVVRLDSDFADMKLPKNVDLMFIGLSYHDIYVKRDDKLLTTTREEFFPQIFSALKPGGKLVIIDHAAKIGTGNSVSTKLHRIDEKWATKDIESAGFKLIRTSDVLRNPNDDLNLDIWNKKVFRKTDRFVHLYEKPNT
ncbi:Mlr5283 protein [hydrothermal vent metagenome]|uniref:Mlr5283 protein n=1 Tax=hydrothermal vent metagenome TaxID=652676 RepID=A0A3B0ZZ81_9ZZZZ